LGLDLRFHGGFPGTTGLWDGAGMAYGVHNYRTLHNYLKEQEIPLKPSGLLDALE
jgi:hypothetical protein